MNRAVFDANVFASAVVGYRREESTPGELLRRWFARAFELITSHPLIVEIERTLANAYFVARVAPDVYDLAVGALREHATLTPITVTVSGVATHPEDDLVLAAAVSAQADYLVTGDRRLQALGSYQGVIIVSPRDFLTLLEGQKSSP